MSTNDTTSELRTIDDCWLVQEFRKRYSEEETQEAILQIRDALLAAQKQRWEAEARLQEQSQLRLLLSRKAEKNGGWAMDGLELMTVSNKRTSELRAALDGVIGEKE